MPLRFVITAIKANGQRMLAFDRHVTYATQDAAEESKKALLSNNSPERVKELIGENLDIREVDCYQHERLPDFRTCRFALPNVVYWESKELYFD